MVATTVGRCKKHICIELNMFYIEDSLVFQVRWLESTENYILLHRTFNMGPVYCGYLSKPYKSCRTLYQAYKGMVLSKHPFHVNNEISAVYHCGLNHHHHGHCCLFQGKPSKWSYPNTPWEDGHALVNPKST